MTDINKTMYEDTASYLIEHIRLGMSSPRAVLRLTHQLYLVTRYAAIAEERENIETPIFTYPRSPKHIITNEKCTCTPPFFETDCRHLGKCVFERPTE